MRDIGPAPTSSLWPLLRTFSWQEMRSHPWRTLAAVVAVMLGVALAFSVHLINASALDEFSRGVRSVSGQPDLEVRGAPGSSALPESVISVLWAQPQVQGVSPVLEISSYAQRKSDSTAKQDAANARVLLRVVGVDALQVAGISPALLPQPVAGERLALFAPATVFLNASAQDALGDGALLLQQGMQLREVQVAGRVAAGGAPLAVMDVAAMQDFFGKGGQLSRVDIRLRDGSNPQDLMAAVQAQPQWPSGALVQAPQDPAQRIGNLSRAYRVNLTVLALIALFTGSFLVYSVLALSVARRSQQFALLGVLGLTAAQRMRLVLFEAAALGLLGSAAGVALGSALAALALRILGADLGGGYFTSASPALQWGLGSALVYAALGLAAALMGAWWPARMAQHLPPAKTLKGLGPAGPHRNHHAAALGLLGLGVLLAFMPPVAGMPLAAYASVACLLVGGIAALPWLVGWVLGGAAHWAQRRVLPLLALERARRVRHTAAVAVSGVVASLSLAVALTVMVSSFRNSVTVWLDTVLPAALYVRTAGSGSANEAAFFEPAFVSAAARIAGVARMVPQRTLALPLDPARPAVALVARALRDGAKQPVGLALQGDVLPVPSGRIGIYVSEAVVDLYGVQLGGEFAALTQALEQQAALQGNAAPPGQKLFVAGIWRDYARQFGTVAMESTDLARWLPQERVSDLAFWLEPSADLQQVQNDLRQLANQVANTPQGEAAGMLEFGSAQQIRGVTLQIFDRSFAVTYWLQAVAIVIGLFGVAASFSAQVLARRKEFGLLAHLGLTRGQILRLVAAEGAAWTTLGALAALALGLAVSVVLVHVVNPQSFHWTMELSVPWLRLLALALAVVVAGTLTAWLSARSAASRDAVLSVKEDW